ncbi:MAG: DUF262 domain-containing protein [Leptolyngbyaceae cyanobacterium SM1_3_5]|nr:DUF262 domain-containing protein [Leptolyngbyaceae cyanobacterium SM1_3_5]
MNNISATFDITKECLCDLLMQIKQGKIQLPDLQRSFCWEDHLIKELLASVSLAYPINSILLLQLGNPEVKFRPRLVEGVHLDQSPEPTKLILDGQQRLTALYMALVSGNPVQIREKRSLKVAKRWYYIDIKQALSSQVERENAIISLPESRLKPGGFNTAAFDCTTREKEFELEMFPVSMMFQYALWRAEYCKYWNYEPQRLKLIDRFELEVVKRYEHYQVPIIQLRPELPKEAVCIVFQKINTISSDLSYFDLLTAMFAGEDFSLRDDWEMRYRRLARCKVLAHLRNIDFLQTVSLISTYQRRQQAIAQHTDLDKLPGIGCGRSEVLRLTVDHYQAAVELATRGYEEAARFLHGQKILNADDLAYQITGSASGNPGSDRP